MHLDTKGQAKRRVQLYHPAAKSDHCRIDGQVLSAITEQKSHLKKRLVCRCRCRLNHHQACLAQSESQNCYINRLPIWTAYQTAAFCR